MKRILFALCALLSLTVLTGCHGRKALPEFTVPDELDTSVTREITFWAKNDTNVNQTRIYEKAISDFEALYPSIKVNMRLYTDYSRIYNDVITNIATQTTPNVCITYPDHIATYMTGPNVVVPLEELMTDERYGLGGTELEFDSPAKDEIVPKFLEECRIDGVTYAVPFMRSTEACYINRDYVEALGYTVPDVLTWDFVWEVSEAAMKKDADGNFLINGQKVMIPFIYKSTDNMTIQSLKQLGADYSDPDGNILIFNDDMKQLLKTVAGHVSTGAFSTFKISSYPANFLNAGQCIFAVDSTAGATWMGSKAPLLDISAENLVEFETVVRTIPQYDPEDPVMISQGPSICIFNSADPQEVLASWLFTQFLLSNSVQTAYSETEGYVPVTLKAQNSPEYQEYLSLKGTDGTEHYDIKIEAAELLLKYTDSTFVTPVFNGSASLRDAAGQMIENVCKSVRRKETVDEEYYDKLFEDVAALYHLTPGSAGIGAEGTQVQEEGLPAGSRALLIGLASVWVLIAAYLVFMSVKSKKAR